MTWFFENADAVQRLEMAFAELAGTPFRPHSFAPGPGGGIDCVGFCEYSMVRTGAVEPFTFPRTDADYQSHRTPVRILRYLRGEEAADDPQSAVLAARFEEILLPQLEAGETENLDEALFLPGDMVVLREAGQVHLPIIRAGRQFVHCLNPHGVQEGNLHDPTFSKHFVALFRARAL